MKRGATGPDDSDAGVVRAFARRRAVFGAITWAVLVWESFWAAFWRPMVLLAIFLAAAAGGLIAAVGGWPQIVILVLFTTGLLWLVVRGWRDFRPVRSGAARRRLEKTSDLAHRPLQSLNDHPANRGSLTLALWREHQRRIRAGLTGAGAMQVRLRLGLPDSGLAKRDPLALRMAAGLLVLIAMVAAGVHLRDNLAAAFTPGATGPGGDRPLALDAWIMPPAYLTGLRAPVFLNQGGLAVGDGAGPDVAAGATVAVPAGSVLDARLSGTDAVSQLQLGADILPFTPHGSDGARITAEILADADLVIRAGGAEIARWRIIAQPDLPPEITAIGTPSVTAQQSLAIAYRARDDYGIAGVEAQFSRLADSAAAGTDDNGGAVLANAPENPPALSVPLPAPAPHRFGDRLVAYHNLTSHPLAGSTLTMRLAATDSAGQIRRSAPLLITLPEREFRHPGARRLIALRRRLVRDPAGEAESVVRELGVTAWTPSLFDAEAGIFLGLVSTRRRLAAIRDDLADGRMAGAELLHGLTDHRTPLGGVLRLLWRMAVHLEDAGADMAMQKLLAAERALAEAMAQGAGMAELERLMNDLEQALHERLRAMAEELQRQQESGIASTPPDADARMVEMRDIQEMLEQIRTLMRSGMREEAEEMLAKLQQLMQNLRLAEPMSDAARDAAGMLKSLEDILRGQQELLDRTYRQSRAARNPMGDGGGSDGSFPENAGDGSPPEEGQQALDGGIYSPEADLQQALRQQLEAMQRRLERLTGAAPPPAFGGAGDAMERAESALRDGAPARALPPQENALQHLRDAGRAARAAIQERFSGEPGLGRQLPGAGGESMSRDPFGRTTREEGDGLDQGDIPMPSQGAVRRAGQIRDELRRRARQRQRPERERHYIRRLLDPFR